MNKLLKRALMVGALAGCLATAAWAGNVETNYFEADTTGTVAEAADGYYITGQSTKYAESDSTEVDTYSFGFNSNGDVIWGIGKRTSGDLTYNCYKIQNTYDDNGRLTKSVSDIAEELEGLVDRTYTYDNDGNLTASTCYRHMFMDAGQMSYTYEYGDHQVTVKYYEKVMAGVNMLFGTYVYTLDDHGNVLKCEIEGGEWNKGSKTVDYTYDAKGNLISIVTTTEGEDDKTETTTFEYNDKNLCVKETRTPSKYYVENNNVQPTVITYEYDANGNAVKETVQGNMDYTSEITYAPLADSKKSQFTDVGTDEYYTDAVIWATANGITTGVSAKEFCPGNPCTRAQLVTFLWRAAGSPDPKDSTNPFTDVNPNAYYAKAVLWAVENGITNGTSKTEFSPDAKCTRAQIVTFIYRAAGEPEVESTGSTFTDVNPKAYYAKAVLWAVKNGITNGYANGEFRPDSTCTRAQGVTFLYRGIGLY